MAAGFGSRVRPSASALTASTEARASRANGLPSRNLSSVRASVQSWAYAACQHTKSKAYAGAPVCSFIKNHLNYSKWEEHTKSVRRFRDVLRAVRGRADCEQGVDHGFGEAALS